MVSSGYGVHVVFHIDGLMEAYATALACPSKKAQFVQLQCRPSRTQALLPGVTCFAIMIECPAVTVLDLASGPMALTGSTRMQATTAELLVVGVALEQALVRLLPELLPAEVLQSLPAAWLSPAPAADQFDALLSDLASPAAVAAIATWITTEHELYAAGGRITYYAADCLMDIFTDTTERAPTFMLPPFRKCDDAVSPPSWAFVKDPLRPTAEAWLRVLGRAPRCLDWDGAVYRELGGPASVCAAPPRLGSGELVKFLIGAEADPSRTEVQPNAALQVLLAPEFDRPEAGDWLQAFAAAAAPFDRRLAVVIDRRGRLRSRAGCAAPAPSRTARSLATLRRGLQLATAAR